jgi:hypothetical protein
MVGPKRFAQDRDCRPKADFCLCGSPLGGMKHADVVVDGGKLRMVAAQELLFDP